jgi:hypothetical protein
LSLRSVPRAGCEEREAPVEASQECRRREESDPRSCELDCKRETVDAPADLGDGVRVYVAQLEVGADSLGTLDKERDRVTRGDGFPAGILKLRDNERRDGLGALPRYMERFAARRQHLQARCRCEQSRDRRSSGDHMLEIVEHEQELALAEVVLERLVDRASGRLLDAETPRDRGYDEVGVGNRCERNKERAGREIPEDVGGDLEGEPRFA